MVKPSPENERIPVVTAIVILTSVIELLAFLIAGPLFILRFLMRSRGTEREQEIRIDIPFFPPRALHGHKNKKLQVLFY